MLPKYSCAWWSHRGFQNTDSWFPLLERILAPRVSTSGWRRKNRSLFECLFFEHYSWVQFPALLTTGWGPPEKKLDWGPWACPFPSASRVRSQRPCLWWKSERVSSRKWRPGSADVGKDSPSVGFLSSGTTDILGRIIFCCKSSLVNFSMSGTVHGIYPPDANTLLYQVMTTKNISGCYWMFLVGQFYTHSPLITQHCSNSSSDINLFYYLKNTIQIHVFNFIVKLCAYYFRERLITGLGNQSQGGKLLWNRMSFICNTSLWLDHRPSLLPFFGLQLVTYHNSHHISFTHVIKTRLSYVARHFSWFRKGRQVRLDSAPLLVVGNLRVMPHWVWKVFSPSNLRIMMTLDNFGTLQTF